MSFLVLDNEIVMLKRENMHKNIEIRRNIVKNYIFYDRKLLKREGGPSTYLYNLRNGFKKIDNSEIEFIYDESETEEKTTKKVSVREKLKNILKKNAFVYERLFLKKLHLKDSLFDSLNKVKDEDNIMFHTTYDCAKASILLPEKTTKILMSHSPEITSKETADLMVSRNKKCNHDYIEKRYFNEFDLPAFKSADIIVFPSKDAMEPYYQTVKNFDEIIKGKKIKFVETGTEKLEFKVSRNDFRKKLGIPEKAFVISFIGRHNSVKGYDNFIEICTKFMKKYDDVYVITGGVGNIESPINDRWTDIGWTNDPGSIANASDVYILSNKRTYFDLVLLEMLSIGITCLASNTGGNRTVAKCTNGVILYDDISDSLIKLDELYCNREKLKEYSKMNKEIYEKKYTIEKFTNRYIDLMKEIQNEKK